MQHVNYIKSTNIDELKKQINSLYQQGKTLLVHTKKTRKSGETYSVIIQGVYPKFFTVKSTTLNVMFTIQYVDVLMGNIAIEEERKEGE